jgi:hypothetical protein
MKKSLISIATIILAFVLATPFALAGSQSGGGGSHGGGGGGGGGHGGGGFSHAPVGGGAPHFSGAPRHYSAGGWTGSQYHPGGYHPTGAAGSRKFSSQAVRSATVHHGKSSTSSQSSHRGTTKTYSKAAAAGRWSHDNRTGRSQLDPQTTARLRNWSGKRDNLAEAHRKHDEHCHHHHGHDWWRHHCVAIVFFDWGFWAWDAGWWYPAWGYDPYYSYYEYNGPIYGFDGLPPDQIVADVQGALQQLGYYQDSVDGILGPMTRAAIADYQRDNGLPITSAIDESLLVSLGFISQ